jgi:mannose-6-phosphate isomerase-like protein (cupin superfamily)
VVRHDLFWGRIVGKSICAEEVEMRMKDTGKSNGMLGEKGKTARKTTVRSMRSLMNFLLEGRDSEGRFAVAEYHARQGSELPPHVHTHESEFFYILEGRLLCFVDHRAISIGPGECLFLRKGRPHAFRIESPMVRALVVIEPAGLEGFFRSLGEHATAANPDKVEVNASKPDLADFAPIYGLRFLSEAEIAEQLPLLLAQQPRDGPRTH